METRKRMRKAFPYSRKILEIFQKAKCRELSIDITPLDNVLFGKARPLSDKEVANILEGHSDDTDASKFSHNLLSSQSESRLRKKENGMVLLPRSFYNEHPAKKVLDNLRTTRSRRSTHEKKNTPPRKKDATPGKSAHKNGTPTQSKITRSRNNSLTVQKENEPLGRRQNKNRQNQLKAGKPSFSKTPKTKPTRQKTEPNGLKSKLNNDKEYQLVFIDPINLNGKKPNTDIKMMSLLDLLNTDKLPSKLWEIERVPPILFKTKSDVTYNIIAAELDALMADKNHSDSTENIMEVDTDEDEIMEIKSNGDDSTIKDDKKICEEIKTIISDKDPNDTIEKNKNDSTEETMVDLTKENTSEDPVELKEENTKEALEDEKELAEVDEIKSIEDNKMDTKKEYKPNAIEEDKMDIAEEEKTDIVEKVTSKDDKKDLIDVDENEAPDEDIENSMEQDNETETLEKDIKKTEIEAVPDDKTEETTSVDANDALDENISIKGKESCASEITENPNPILKKDNEEIDKEETEKVQEEFPSIMDLLNEEPLSEQVSQKDLVNEPSNSIEISTEEKPKEENIETAKDVLFTDSEIYPKGNCLHGIPDLPPTQVIKISPDNIIEDVANNNEDKNEKLDAPIATAKKSDETIRSVVFRRFSEDKQTYDRLVTFQADLEYTVKLNNKEVELLGAPKYMTSAEDLQILLQIVDEVNLDSFNVICKS